MKLLFNSTEYTFVDYMLYRLNDLEDELYKHQDVYFDTILNIDVFRATNLKNGKHIIKLYRDNMKLFGFDNIHVVIIEFDNFKEMSDYVDTLRLFRF